MQKPFEIRRREATVILDGVVDEWLDEENPGVVGQSIDRAEPRKRGFDNGLGRLGVVDVAIDAGQGSDALIAADWLTRREVATTL